MEQEPFETPLHANRMPPLLNAILRRYLNFTVPKHIATTAYRVPVWGGMATPGLPGPWHLEFYRRALANRPGAFVDGGMNLGQTLLCVRAVDRDRPFIGFEPNPICVAYLEKLIEVNALTGITVVPAGLSDKMEFRKLYFPPGDAANAAATVILNLRPHSHGHASRIIPVVPFDDVATGLGAARLGFVKIDVEGHELEALRGMTNTMLRDRPLAMVEVLPRAGGPTPDEAARRRQLLHDLLSAWRYAIRQIEPVPGTQTQVTIEPFAGFKGLPFDPNASYDYLFIPEELVQELEAAFRR